MWNHSFGEWQFQVRTKSNLLKFMITTFCWFFGVEFSNTIIIDDINIILRT